ncbi:MAG TPA: efflux RND transporter permease subunit [Terriglobia bacterium]|nr:efflux RND transporter permease subunit [Terriglobia bacterium]
MKIADVSIRRPVFAFMMSLALITIGAFSYKDLGVDLMPKTDLPNVNVNIGLPGASAEEVESQITKPVEAALNSIAGIDELRTTSNQGNSNTNITFTLEKPIDVAVQDVRDKIGPIVRNLPNNATPPVIQKSDPDSAPVLTLAMYGGRDLKELTGIVDKNIKQVIETVNGVADVQFSGDRRRQIQLLLDADRMNAYGVSVDQVRLAVQRQNIEVPGGTFISGPSEIALRTLGRIENVKDFNRVILSQRDGRTVTFGDIGRVVDTVEQVRSVARVDGQNAVSLSIYKQTGSNTVSVVDDIMRRLETIKETLPNDINVVVRRDQSVFIRRSIEDIQHHLILGSLLAAIVVFLFLRNIRSTIIAAVAIPVSLIGTFGVMRAMGMTLNNMTLLALSLATGIVIDDAIVVLENIFRYVEEKGMTPREAASEATAEIGLAVLATTLSLVVIFLPVVFITGQIGQYLLAFGVVSVSAIMLSMFVSFTLTPAMCATWLRSADAGGHTGQSKSQGFYAWMDRQYGRLLTFSLRHRALMLLIGAAVTASAVALYPRVGTELVPEDDQGEFNISVNLPTGTSFERTQEYFKDLEPMLQQLPAVQTVFTNINAGGAQYFVGMTPLEERAISQQELIRQARALIRSKYPGIRSNVNGGTDLSGASTAGNSNRGGGQTQGGNRLQLLVQGPDIAQLQVYVPQLIEKLQDIPGLAEVNTNLQPTQPELRVEVDRVRAADLGVSIDSLAANVRTLVGGDLISTLRDGDEQYDVQLRLDEAFRNDPVRMGNLPIASSTQKLVRLNDVARLKSDNGPARIDRYNRQRNFGIFANLDKLPLGEAVAAAQQKINELDLKPGYRVVFSGSARTLATASNDFTLAMLLAVAFIYMVLASQFNSLVHPFTIMTSLPLSLPAGLLALLLFGHTLNIYSGIGMLMLFGIVKKNSILQVDYTNALREGGMNRTEALIAANHVRLRPILMTTISIVAGMLPIALGRGSGAGSRASMAITIIGGQMLCLLLTLLITPVVYSYFDDLRNWKTFHWPARARAPRETPEGRAAGARQGQAGAGH